MEKLIIEATDNSPRIVLDPEARYFEFSGESRPENVRKFYLPILEWMEDYTFSQEKLKENERSPGLSCQFNFEYFNSTSAKYILDIFKALNAINALGIKLKIKWLYEEDDEDMLEVGQEMSRMSKLPFEYIKSDT
ncbi:MAG: DUF1987 domain-containing protein [Bacteroidales bacterium]|nr:DUF1987 domain-containing protein [Bacteroidales bacterium]